MISSHQRAGTNSGALISPVRVTVTVAASRPPLSAGRQQDGPLSRRKIDALLTSSAALPCLATLKLCICLWSVPTQHKSSLRVPSGFPYWCFSAFKRSPCVKPLALPHPLCGNHFLSSVAFTLCLLTPSCFAFSALPPVADFSSCFVFGQGSPCNKQIPLVNSVLSTFYL